MGARQARFGADHRGHLLERATATVRRWLSDRRPMRDTCICETPMSSPISACVRSSSKRRRTTLRARRERLQQSIEHRAVLGEPEAVLCLWAPPEY